MNVETLKGEILKLETSKKLANREKAIKFIKREIKDMPYNGCKIRLKEVLRILEEK